MIAKNTGEFLRRIRAGALSPDELSAFEHRLRRSRLTADERQAARDRCYDVGHTACVEMGVEAPPRDGPGHKCASCGTPWGRGRIGPGTTLTIECKRCGMPTFIVEP